MKYGARGLYFLSKMSFKVDILLRFKSVFSKSNFFFPFRVRKISLNHPKCPIFHDSNDTSHTSVPPNHTELLHQTHLSEKKVVIFN